MAGTSKPMAGMSSKGKSRGEEVLQTEDPRPHVLACGLSGTNGSPTQRTCTCKEEYIHCNSIHKAFGTLIIRLREGFQQYKPRVFETCYKILHQFTFREMAGHEGFDQLTCVLVNEAQILKEATQVFPMYMSARECLRRLRDIKPINMLILHKIFYFYGLGVSQIPNCLRDLE